MVTRRPGATQDEVRRHNLSTLLRAVHEVGALSRAELTGSMGLNRSTIKDLVDELTELGAVRQGLPDGGRGDGGRADGGRAGAGRPSLVVHPCPDRIQVLAVDVGVDRVDVGLVGLGGAMIARRRGRLTTTEPDAVVAIVRHLADGLLAGLQAQVRLLAVGVSVPGAVRLHDGFVRLAPNLGWFDEPLGAALRGTFGMPVRIGNDADLGVLAEHRRGVARGYDDVVFIAGDVGVGGGFIFGGRPMLGSGGYAGELGHMRLRTATPGRARARRCRCGALGCWETEIGARAIAEALAVPTATTEELVAAVRAAVESRSSALDGVARAVGLGLANLVNIVNPRMIIVGGVLREIMPLVGDVVRETIAEAALLAPAQQVIVTVPQLGADAVLVGAAELAWHDLLLDPVAVLRSGGPVVDPRPQVGLLAGAADLRPWGDDVPMRTGR